MSDELLQPRSLDAATGPQKPDPGGKGPRIIGWGLLVMLMGLGGIWWLSSEPADVRVPVATPIPSPTPPPTPQATPDPTLRLAAEKQLEAFLALLGPLRASEPERWAEEVWQGLQLDMTAADQLMADKKYAEAASAYQALIVQAEGLNRQLPGLPALLFPRAQAAYAQGEKEEAVGLLKLILFLDPAHAAAKDLLPRAENADRSFDLLKKATAYAEDKAWDLAWANLQELKTWDAAFPGGQVLESAVAAEISKQEFAKWISQAILALENQDLTSAQALVNKAAAFDPDHPSVRGLQNEILDLIRQRKVMALKSRAETLHQLEDWQGEHQLWLEMKSLDAEAPWIQAGLEASLRWKIAEEKITKGLADPGAAQTGRWAEEMQQREGWPPGLEAKAGQMIAAWKLSTTPVTVRLRSDAETRVEISKIGKWEPFIQKDITLKPGAYVAKGWRLGYRDVRVPFEVTPGQQNQVVEVICVEGIR